MSEEMKLNTFMRAPVHPQKMCRGRRPVLGDPFHIEIRWMDLKENKPGGGMRRGPWWEFLETYQKWGDQAESGKDSLTAHLGAWRWILKQLLCTRQLTGESQMGSALGG